jgi:hypothetical protein
MIDNKEKFTTVNSVGRTLHYISRGSGFKPRSSYLFTLMVEFLATKLVNKKKIYKVLA